MATWPLIAGFPVSPIPVANVSTVPQRSPLRYPGGKTWLVPHIREWLRQTRPEIVIEPFAGGAIVSLTAVMEQWVSKAVMLERDRDVAALWHVALGDVAGLIRLIKTFEPTREGICNLARETPTTRTRHAFRTLVLNRTRYGGIAAPGAGFSQRGENGKGIASRWYPDTLIARLSRISEHAHRIAFLEGDAMQVLPVLLKGWGRHAAVFLDPPYTGKDGKRAGRRLYRHSEINHSALFSALDVHGSNFLMTYDTSPEIVDLVARHKFCACSLTMKNTHHNKVPELVITRDPIFA